MTSPETPTPWTTLTLRVDFNDAPSVAETSNPDDQSSQQQHIEAIEAVLFATGALSVTLLDAEDDPIHEPDPGALPLWPHVLIQALWLDVALAQQAVDRLVNEGLIRDHRAVALGSLADQEWTRAWMDRFAPMSFGERLWVCPSHLEPDPSWPVVLRLDPGLAFGSGTHPTTAMCLRFLDEWATAFEASHRSLDDTLIVDFGCGSGILAIAAAKLGAGRIIAVDHDPQALVATEENAKLNGCLAQIEIIGSETFFKNPPLKSADLVLANILAGPLIELAPKVSQWVAPQGHVVLSGILSNQASLVEKAYQALDPSPSRRTQEDWVCLAFAQKA